MAQTSRNRVVRHRSAPTRLYVPSWMTRSNSACSVSGSSPTSSRKSVPPSASANAPSRAAQRTGERTPLVAEQLAARQRRDDRGAVHDDQVPLALPRVQVVEQPRQQLLPGAALARPATRGGGERRRSRPPAGARPARRRSGRRTGRARAAQPTGSSIAVPPLQPQRDRGARLVGRLPAQHVGGPAGQQPRDRPTAGRGRPGHDEDPAAAAGELLHGRGGRLVGLGAHGQRDRPGGGGHDSGGRVGHVDSPPREVLSHARGQRRAARADGVDRAREPTVAHRDPLDCHRW